MSVLRSAEAGSLAPSLTAVVGSLLYEGVLACAIAFSAAASLVLVMRWASPLLPAQRLALQAWIVVVLGAYFTRCWVRSGQTLALKTWKLRVETRAGAPIGWFTAILRYLAGWLLVLPGLLLASWGGTSGLKSALLFAAGVLAFAGVALALPGRRLPHDRLAGTRVVRIVPLA